MAFYSKQEIKDGIHNDRLALLAAFDKLRAAKEQPYEKEFATCTICGKYKGCWTDSGVCSDCDEAEDERKMQENEEGETSPELARQLPASQYGAQQRLLEKVRGTRAAVVGPFLFGAPSPYAKAMARTALRDAKHELADFYRAVATR